MPFGSTIPGVAKDLQKNTFDRLEMHREDAQECVSDTYLKTWESIPPQRPNYFYAFRASICRHVSFHKLDWILVLDVIWLFLTKKNR